jgi:dTDP-4-amino-4,6-dideoxygalactose transaminase
MEAIESSLRPLDIGLGDEVITTPMTAIATVVAITQRRGGDEP